MLLIHLEFFSYSCGLVSIDWGPMAGMWYDGASLGKVPQKIEMGGLGLSWGQICCKDEKYISEFLVWK